MENNLYQYNAECLEVVDGDTLTLKVDLGFGTFKIDRFRMYGINTPETYGVPKTSEEYIKGSASKARTTELVMGKKLIVKTHRDKKDKYGRYLAEIYVPELVDSVNQTLIKEGLATPFMV